MAGHMSARTSRIALLGAALGVVATASPALAGGNVLPPTARPKGYSLAEAARATAVFNVGPRTPGTLPQVPFQILYVTPGQAAGTFVVRPGTMLYVPIFYVTDSPPILGDYPDLDDPEDDLNDGDNSDDDMIDYMLCTYDKVQRVKNKWKCTLKDGILTTNKKEYVSQSPLETSYH